MRRIRRCPHLLVALLAAFVGCGPEEPQTTRSGLTNSIERSGEMLTGGGDSEPAESLTYTIEASRVGGISNKKLVLTARLNRKATESELRRLAFSIKGEHNNLGRIFFLLPGMSDDWGAWARSDFNPELDITIFGLSTTDDKAIDRADATIPGEILGRWSSETVGNASCLTLFREDDRTYIKTTFKDGGSITSELVEKPSNDGKRYEEVKGLPGEFFSIDASGALKRGDRRGIWLTLPPVNRQLERQTVLRSSSPPQQRVDSTETPKSKERATGELLNVSVTIEPAVTSDRRVIVNGTTNLPPGTRLSVGVSDAILDDPTFATGARVSSDGTFQSEKILGPLSGVEDGWYVASVSKPVLAEQPAHVRRIIGEKGDNLTGPLVSKEYEIGAFVEAEVRFLVGGDDAGSRQLSRLKRELEEHKAIVQQIKELFSRVEETRTKGLFNDSKYSAFQIGATFRELYFDHKAISDRVEKIGRTPAGLTLGWPLADLMTMLLSARDGKENDYREARLEYVNDLNELEEFIHKRDARLATGFDDLAPNSRAPDSGEISISEKDVSIGGGAAGFRTWTSANGKFSADAKLVSFANGIVTIENRDGKQIKVAQDKLSGADREFIDKWRRERRR